MPVDGVVWLRRRPSASDVVDGRARSVVEGRRDGSLPNAEVPGAVDEDAAEDDVDATAFEADDESARSGRSAWAEDVSGACGPEGPVLVLTTTGKSGTGGHYPFVDMR
jgi:hypothetical protein